MDTKTKLCEWCEQPIVGEGFRVPFTGIFCDDEHAGLAQEMSAP